MQRAAAVWLCLCCPLTVAAEPSFTTEADQRTAWELVEKLRAEAGNFALMAESGQSGLTLLSTGKLFTDVRTAGGLARRYELQDLTQACDAALDALDQTTGVHQAEALKAPAGAAAEALDAVVAELLAAAPAVAAYDVLNDDGRRLAVSWRPVEDAQHYRIERRSTDDEQAEWKTLAEAGASALTFTDTSIPMVLPWEPAPRFQYRVSVVGADGAAVLLGASEAAASRSWFHGGKQGFALFTVVLFVSVVYFIQRVRSGAKLKVRAIAGLEAVDDAVGRATEMGRSMIFVPGILEIQDIETIAGLIVLGRVAKVTAEHDADIQVPVRDPLVMVAARETVQTAYVDAGRPDAYDERMVYFTTQEQFAYVANITGTMVREKPAACFYMGAFYAESLILAETGNLTGTVQVAGTARVAQLPFFVAACDYTLMGEELFAASAYLSGDPAQLGSLKGQDVGKLVVGVLMLVGALCATLVLAFDWHGSFPHTVYDYILNDLLATQD